MVPWKMPTGTTGELKVFDRYYHLFTKGELEDLVLQAGANILESGYDRDNYYVIAEKLI